MGGTTPRSMLPSWAPLNYTSHDLDSEVYRCCMTELQLQAIVNQQGIEGTGESNLDMTTVNGVSVSKWHLDSVTYGKEVSDALKESVKKYLQQFVGSERVFPTQNGAPRIMTEFINPIVSSCATNTPRVLILGLYRRSRPLTIMGSPLRRRSSSTSAAALPSYPAATIRGAYRAS
jgi:hypothetical protein